MIGFVEVRSNPLVMRLYRSVGASSRSYRSPRFNVSDGFTRMSSWRKKARYLFWLDSAGGAIMEPPVGRPQKQACESLSGGGCR